MTMIFVERTRGELFPVPLLFDNHFNKLTRENIVCQASSLRSSRACGWCVVPQRPPIICVRGTLVQLQLKLILETLPFKVVKAVNLLNNIQV